MPSLSGNSVINNHHKEHVAMGAAINGAQFHSGLIPSLVDSMFRMVGRHGVF